MAYMVGLVLLLKQRLQSNVCLGRSMQLCALPNAAWLEALFKRLMSRALADLDCHSVVQSAMQLIVLICHMDQQKDGALQVTDCLLT